MFTIKSTIITLFLFIGGWPVLFSQIELQWESGARFHLRSVEVLKEDLSVWKDESHPLKQLFYEYNHPASVDAYKLLFYREGFPSIIDQVYDEWRAKMKGIRTEIQGIFYGQLDSLDIACIQYAYTQTGYDIQMSFIAYRTEGRWYPLESGPNLVYQPFMSFMAIFQPELAFHVLHPTPSDIWKPIVHEIQNRCQAQGRVMTASCIQHIAEEWGLRKEGAFQHMESPVFKSRFKRELSPATAEKIEKELDYYLTSLQLQKEVYDKAKYYFSKNEVMQAITIMQENGLQVKTSELFENLNRIQQTHHYRTIEHTSLGSLKHQ